MAAAGSVQVEPIDLKSADELTQNEKVHVDLIVATIRKEMHGKPFDKKKLYSLIIASISVTMKLAIDDGAKKKALVMRAFETILTEQSNITEADREDILTATNAGIDLLYYQKKDGKCCC